MLEIISKADEFSEVVVRPKEHAWIKKILKDRTISLKGGSLKVAAILLAYMHGEIPSEFRSDGWVIKQNAERLLKALEHVLQNYSTPFNVAIVKNTSTLIKNSIPDEAEPLLQIQSLDIKTVKTLVQHGIKSLQELAVQTPQTLTAIGINEAKAKRVLKELEKYQTDYLQQKLTPDESTVKDCLIDAVPVESENKTVGEAGKEPVSECLQNVENQDTVKELIEQLENNPDSHPVYLTLICKKPLLLLPMPIP